MNAKSFQTLNELFLQAVESSSKPDVFLTKSSGQYRGVPAREVMSTVAGLGRALDTMGVAVGDRVALLAENRVEWALADYAVLGLGAITVPLYSTLLEDDIEFILRDSGAKGIVVSTAGQLEKVLKARSRAPELLSFVVVMDPCDTGGQGVRNWKEVVGSGRASDPVEFFRAKARVVRPGDIATIVYTSGTTGNFKGVVLTHANIVSNVHACSTLFDHGPGDVAMSFLPLAHIFERMIALHYLARGVSIAYAESLDSLPQNLREVRPTLMAVVPRLLQKIREKVVEEVHQLSPSKQRLFQWAMDTGKEYSLLGLAGCEPAAGLSLKRAIADRLVFRKIRGQLGGRFRMFISGSAPLGRDVAEFFYSLGIPVYEGYGLTETSPVITVNSPGAVKLGTVGTVIPGVEVRLGEEIIEDSEGRTGQEILVRGPNVTSGYYHPDELNGEAFKGGWFRTGDLGRLDADGFLTITGRKKNLFKTSGGKYVSPEKLEHLFQGHRYVVQVVVLGDARKFVGALVVPNFAALEAYARGQGIGFASREELISNPDIRAFMQRNVDEACAHLPPYERIRQIVLIAGEFTIGGGELSATLKVKRPVVEARYRDLIEEMFARRPPEPATK